MSKPIDDDRLVCTICPCNQPLEESYLPPRYNDALIGNIGPAIWQQPELQQRKVGFRCKDIVKRCGLAYSFGDVKFLHAWQGRVEDDAHTSRGAACGTQLITPRKTVHSWPCFVVGSERDRHGMVGQTRVPRSMSTGRNCAGDSLLCDRTDRRQCVAVPVQFMQNRTERASCAGFDEDPISDFAELNVSKVAHINVHTACLRSLAPGVTRSDHSNALSAMRFKNVKYFLCIPGHIPLLRLEKYIPAEIHRRCGFLGLNTGRFLSYGQRPVLLFHRTVAPHQDLILHLIETVESRQIITTERK